jgi:hypothetical protein
VSGDVGWMSGADTNAVTSAGSSLTVWRNASGSPASIAARTASEVIGAA